MLLLLHFNKFLQSANLHFLECLVQSLPLLIIYLRIQNILIDVGMADLNVKLLINKLLIQIGKASLLARLPLWEVDRVWCGMYLLTYTFFQLVLIWSSDLIFTTPQVTFCFLTWGKDWSAQLWRRATWWSWLTWNSIRGLPLWVILQSWSIKHYLLILTTPLFHRTFLDPFLNFSVLFKRFEVGFRIWKLVLLKHSVQDPEPLLLLTQPDTLHMSLRYFILFLIWTLLFQFIGVGL